MKKTIIISTGIIFVLFISIIGCKKDIKQEEKPQPVNTEPEITAAAIFSDTIYISEYDFLIFPTVEDLEDYKAFVLELTHAEIQGYLTTKGFTQSLGASLYDEEYADETVTEDQVINYVINTNRITQIEDVVIKPVGETECETVNWEFLLAIKVENLDEYSHEDLINGVYDENSMNKFATNHSEESTLSLLDFMSSTPTGYEETEANECPEAEEARRPFWGWDEGSCTPGEPQFNAETNTWFNTYMQCDPSYHIFWIRVKKGSCGVVYNCE